ncbi:MAG: MATE family efflux transporter [Lachnospiraceae bacterium]|nr:MATE family efflux transporter [Lachnospiraceae bacterium]
MKNNITDMTTGSPAKHILLFALPMLIGNLFQQVYNLADSIIVGNFVGPDAFGAIGATSSITFLFFALCNGVGNGGGIVTSQFFGAHDDESVKKCIINTGLIMLVVPMIIGALAFVLSPSLLRLLDTPPEFMADATLYVRFMCCGLLFVSLYNYLSSVLRALGDSKSPLYFLIFSTIVNVVLDILFVCVIPMGVAGAALATLMAQFISVITCAVYATRRNPYFRFKKSDFAIDRNMIRKVVRLGVPMSMQFSLIAISSMALQRVVNSFGSSVATAFTTTNRIEQLIHQPYMTLGASLSTFCGQNYGAKRTDRVYEGYKTGTIILLVLSCILIVVMQFFGRSIASLFLDADESPYIITLATIGLQITSMFYMALGMIYVIRGVLTGIGDAMFQLINGIVEVIGRFTFPILLTTYMDCDAAGIWISSGVVWCLSAYTAYLRYRSYFVRKNQIVIDAAGKKTKFYETFFTKSSTVKPSSL